MGLGKIRDLGVFMAQKKAGMNPTAPASWGGSAPMPKFGMMGARGMAAEIARRAGVTGDDRTTMPKFGMMGGRRMAEEIARRAGVTGDDRTTMKKGGKVKKMAKGGPTASKRADGCAKKGKTKGRMV